MRFALYAPEQGSNWNAMNGGGVWVQDGETALVRCPSCSKAFNLKEHTISGAGEVSPAVECPNSECEFVDDIVLDSWEVLNVAP